MATGRTDILREILLKPETATEARLQIDAIIKNIHRLAEFDIIGMTEKELGRLRYEPDGEYRQDTTSPHGC